MEQVKDKPCSHACRAGHLRERSWDVDPRNKTPQILTWLWAMSYAKLMCCAMCFGKPQNAWSACIHLYITCDVCGGSRIMPGVSVGPRLNARFEQAQDWTEKTDPTVTYWAIATRACPLSVILGLQASRRVFGVSCDFNHPNQLATFSFFRTNELSGSFRRCWYVWQGGGSRGKACFPRPGKWRVFVWLDACLNACICE